MSAQSIAILSSASSGGAGIAALRMWQAFHAHLDAQVDFITAQTLGGHLPSDVAPMSSRSNLRVSDTLFGVEYPGFARGWIIEMFSGYDLINVHWASFMLSLAELDALARRGKRMIFSLHDFHYLTGGCHYPAGCTGYEAGCTACPQVDRSRASPSLIARNMRIKHSLFARPNVHLTAPSAYLRDRAVAAGIAPFDRAHVLRNPYAARALPDLAAREGPQRLLLIADALGEGRKQMGLALDTLDQIARSGTARPLHIDLVGACPNEMAVRMRNLGLPHKIHGQIRDEAALTTLFAQADAMLTCSNEDNWPNILVEAGAYGCMPIVGPSHGCEEFVRLYQFGEVAKTYTPEAFAIATQKILTRWTPEEAARAIEPIRADHQPKTVAAGMTDILWAMDQTQPALHSVPA